MEATVLWNLVLTILIGAVAFFMSGKFKELDRINILLNKTREEIASLKKKLSEEMGGQDAQIFEAHLLVLEDRTLIDEVLRGLERERQNVEYVFQQVVQ